jgi:predicted transposase/invertase (TIGR01784 family)
MLFALFRHIKGMKNLSAQAPARRLNPLNDFMFQKVMGEKGDESQLLDFLNAVLGRSGDTKIASVTILENKTFTPDFIGGKASVLDVKAELDNGTKIDIEVQILNEENMARRSLFYWSREYTRNLSAGQDYSELPVVIAINIVDYQFFEVGGFHTCFRLREDTERDLVLTDALESHFLDMVKWRRLKGKDVAGDPLHQWMAWLNEKSPPELIDEVKKMNEAILLADERMVFLSSDEEAIDAYERRQKALFDETNRRKSALKQRDYALKEGARKGMAKGLSQGKLEIAQKMKAAGRPLTEIVEFTGLSLETIEKMRN